MTPAGERFRARSRIESVVGRSGRFTPAFVCWLEEQPDAVLLETARTDRDEHRSYVFLEPAQRIECRSVDEVPSALRELERAVAQGLYAAGFLSYELGSALEPEVPLPGRRETPLLWFGVYEEPWIYSHKTALFERGQERARAVADQLQSLPATPVVHELVPEASIREPEFHRALSRIKEHIREGNTYQVNYSFKMRFDWEHSPADLYCQLRDGQKVPYSALLRAGKTWILSFSPELFFRTDGRTIRLRPMKGTAPRGRTQQEDEDNRSRLLNSAKDRAENLMIVDLLRSDVGRIAETGTVRVPEYYSIEEYETVFQATSVIEAELPAACTFSELLGSVFPCGSITGAPKIRTMQIIQELEQDPRGVYTGAVGFLGPKKRAVFSVAIRTVALDTRRGRAEMGVGSGVTYDSDPAGEYRECLDKARFLGVEAEGFGLLETLGWSPATGWLLLEEHLQRLELSARHFGRTLEMAAVRDSLEALDSSLEASGAEQPMKVRLVVDPEGVVHTSAAPLAPLREVEPAAIASFRIDPCNRFLYHKTTHRALYDRALQEALEKGWFDQIFVNDRGEITEGARSNVVLKHEDRHRTPPVSSGLLAGVFRRHLLESPDFSLHEEVLTLEDLASADAVYCCNSVRGLQRVEIVENPAPE